MNLSDNLLKKASAQELSHFYIVESAAPFEQAQTELLDFTHNFIRDYYQKVEGHKQSISSLMDHPDVFVLGLDNEDKKESAFYSVTEAEALAKFFEWRAVQSKRKFAVILNAHKINTIVANKWLKLLEEPPLLSTVFMLNPKRVKLLDTIHSRALHLRLPFVKDNIVSPEWQDFLNETKGLSLAPFLERFTKGDRPLQYWVDQLIKWESEQLSHPESKSILQKWLKDYSEMEVFHQSAATKWTLFFHHLKVHVLPRL